MSFKQQFTDARKAFEEKITHLSPSVDVLVAVKDAKMKDLAAKLDEGKGKVFTQMDALGNTFDAYRLTYFSKIDKKVAKDPQASALKGLIKTYSSAIEQLGDNWEKACDAQRKAEMASAAAAKKATETGPANPKVAASGGGASGGGASGGGNVRGLLDKTADEYKKRLAKQLQVSRQIDSYCKNMVGQLGSLYATLQKNLVKVKDLAARGQLQAAVSIRNASLMQTKKLNEMAAAAQKKYDVELGKFVKGGIMTPEDVAESLHFRLPATAKKGLDNITKSNAAQTRELTSHVKSAKEKLEDCEHFASEGDNVTEEIVKLSGGPGFGKSYVDAVVKMSQRVKPVIGTAFANTEKLRSTTIPLLRKSVRVLQTKTPPNQVQAAQAYLTANSQVLQNILNSCMRVEVAARNMINAEKKKIPPDIMRGQAGPLIDDIEQQLNDLAAANTMIAQFSKSLMTVAAPFLR